MKKPNLLFMSAETFNLGDQFQCIVDALGEASKANGLADVWTKTQPKLNEHLDAWKKCDNAGSKLKIVLYVPLCFIIFCFHNQSLDIDYFTHNFSHFFFSSTSVATSKKVYLYMVLFSNTFHRFRKIQISRNLLKILIKLHNRSVPVMSSVCILTTKIQY